MAASSTAGSWDSHGFGANMTIQLNKLSAMKKYKVSDINFLNPATRSVVDGARESFGNMIILRPGGIYTKSELKEVLDHLSSSLFFEKIEIDAKTNPDGTLDLNIPYRERVYPSKTMFRCLSVGMLPDEDPIEVDPNLTVKEESELLRAINDRQQRRIERARECILPQQLQDEIEWTLKQENFLRASLLSRIVNQIQKWYHRNGYNFARVVGLGPNLYNQGGEIVFEVNEGDITDLGVKFQDKMKNACEGNTNIQVIRRALPEEVAVGRAFNERAFVKAFQNIRSLNLFSYVNIVDKQDETTGAVSADFILQENPRMWSEVEVDWKLNPRLHGLPTIDMLRPGARIEFGYRNIKGLNRSFEGAMTLSNLFELEDNTNFNFNYTHPYLDGIDNPRNRTFRAACFNTRSSSPVFRGANGGDDDIPIWVDRRGIKATITEDYTKQSTFTYGLVAEDINIRDEYGNNVGNNVDRVPYGRGNGPSTTLSGTGNDRLAFLQANLTKDNTRFVNGALVGARDVFQVDQGIGIGTKFAFFNRAKVSATRFIPLRKVKEGKGNAAPPVLVLHGLFGNCVGDLPNHKAFTIGGPNSVRGYDVGEIGASRCKLEVAAEIRVPVKNATMYGFAEHGNDMGSSVRLTKNPTMGHGSSYGLGIKFGQVRAEYAVDHNTRKGGFFIHFGDRF